MVNVPFALPVLAIGSDKTFCLCESVRDVAISPRAEFYDLNGQVWAAVESTAVADLEMDLFGKRLLAYRLRFAESRPSDLSELKRVLRECIESGPDDVYCQIASHEELLANVDRAAGWRELMQVVRDFA